MVLALVGRGGAGPGRTRPRTHCELTEAGREALTRMARRAGVRVGIQRAYQDLEEMERRALQIPRRTRYLRLIDDYARRRLDVQREWLDAVQEELERRR